MASSTPNSPNDDHNNNGTTNGSTAASSKYRDYSVPSNLSTSALQSRLTQLKNQVTQHGQLLTQRLATSQSGQDLLHMGSSLSTLPPDLHNLITQLHPFLAAVDQSHEQQTKALQELVQHALEIRKAERRSRRAMACADAFRDLVAAEKAIQNDMQWRLYGTKMVQEKKVSEENEQQQQQDALDHISSLERAAHVTLCLLQDLQTATNTVASLAKSDGSPAGNTFPSLRLPLPQDTEQAQFFLKLAPRIRKLESDTALCLCQRLELVLKQLAQDNRTDDTISNNNNATQKQDSLLLMLGHLLRGLALLGRGPDAESIFARVAIMPLLRSMLSMGRLDQGGSRGECAGLESLLHEILQQIQASFGPALRYVQALKVPSVDLVTCGVWAPLATALMADAGIKMAIFSPGIASILQSNYVVLDQFLAQLASRLLLETSEDDNDNAESSIAKYYYKPNLTNDCIQLAQERIYKHSKTAEFNKKWNLPIYYQLRFGEACRHLNAAIEITKRDGWAAEGLFHGTPEEAEELKQRYGFELALFLELHHLLLGMWRPDVILKPLTNRFLRGSVQMVGRVLTFIKEGMDGTVKFGQEPLPPTPTPTNGEGSTQVMEAPSFPARSPYCWGETEEDVGSVAWELTILESTLRHDYVDLVCAALNADAENPELRTLVKEVLEEACDQIHPLIDTAWNESIVDILTKKCSAPLAAVKGVAATYRMTNRPPPTLASHFVSTILQPLKQFSNEFSSRTPERVGLRWKQQIVVTISDKYAAAVEELLSTVARTEVALQRQNTRNRRAARISAAVGMSDGDKVKLQLYLDCLTYTASVEEAGVNPKTVRGIAKLQELTKEGEALHQGKTQEN